MKILKNSYITFNKTGVFTKKTWQYWEYVELRGLETFVKVADGKSTKLIIPSEIQNHTSLLSVAKESIGEIKEKEINK